MSYEKHTWETGEIITEAKMNNIEDGIDQLKNNSNDEYPLRILHFDSTTYKILPGELEKIGITSTENLTNQWLTALKTYDVRIQDPFSKKLSERAYVVGGYMGVFLRLEAISEPHFTYDSSGANGQFKANLYKVLLEDSSDLTTFYLDQELEVSL